MIPYSARLTLGYAHLYFVGYVIYLVNGLITRPACCYGD